MTFKRYVLFLLSVLSLPLSAQEEPSKSVGTFSGEWRNIYMITVNKDSLKNFQALATGGFIRYQYETPKHWTFTGAVYTSVNLDIQDITSPDPVTGRISRYESGLFDLDNLDERVVIFPGELNIQYAGKFGRIIAGRMKIATPFINGQDGRMIPTFVQGIQAEFNISKDLRINTGWFHQTGPRSGGEFFRIDESLGLYPPGINPDGTPSGYRHNTESNYILVTDLKWQKGNHFSVRMVDYHADNLFHALYVKPAWTWKRSNRTFTIEAETVLESRVNEGGNPDPALRYFTDNHAAVFGFQFQTELRSTWRIAYNRITDHGRFLFPREWGREFLFGFQKLERSEGQRDSHTLLLANTQGWQFGKDELKTELSAGYHWIPSPTNAASNKYAMPSYAHFNIDLTYTSEKLKHFQPALLFTYKLSQGDFPENPNFYLNKVDMYHITLWANFVF